LQLLKSLILCRRSHFGTTTSKTLENETNNQNAGEGGSCVMSQAGLGNDQKQLNPEDILKDPFIEKAIQLLDPEGIKIRAKV